MVYVATGRVSLVIIGLVLFVLGSLLMATLFDHVRVRIDIWLDPFADPLGTGYQVVQALHAFARGGLVGVGLGAGLPEVGGRLPIPEVHTDFPLAALGEELGIVGVLAILGLFLVVVERGLRIGAAAADDFRALLAIGLSLVIGIQAFIIAAGNLKVLPLTGVTLPFISYGGSSLLANALVIGLLLALSDKGVEPPPPPIAVRRWRGLRRRSRGMIGWTSATRRPLGRGIMHVAIVLSLGFGTLAAALGYWGVVRAPDLVRSPYDPAVIAAARTVPRGRIVDRDGKVLARNEKDANGEYYRVYAGDAISHVVGYASVRYGRPGSSAPSTPSSRVSRATRCRTPSASSGRRRTTRSRPDPLALVRPPASRRPRARRTSRAPSSCSTRGPARSSRWPRRRPTTRPPSRTRRRPMRRSRRSPTTSRSRCCRARRWAGTCRARSSRS